VAGEHSTTEPLMLTLSGGCVSKQIYYNENFTFH
jgi:hypothetical protein